MSDKPDIVHLLDITRKQHKVVIDVPSVKFWIFTIKRAYKMTRFIDCEAGDYCHAAEMAKDIIKDNALLKHLRGIERV